MGLTGGVGLLVIGVLFVAVAAGARGGDLPRNGAFGIRTRHTQASDAAWEAGHRAAATPFRWLGVLSVAIALALVASAPLATGFEEPHAITIGLFVVGYGGVLLGAVWVARTANRAARSVGPAD